MTSTQPNGHIDGSPSTRTATNRRWQAAVALTVLVGGATFGIAQATTRAGASGSTIGSGLVQVLAGRLNVANSSGKCPTGPATQADLNSPAGLAIFGGNLYIADSLDNCVVELTSAGDLVPVAGTGTPGYNGDGIAATSAELYDPDGLSFDSAGDLFIADTLNERIREVNTEGIISTVAGNGSYGLSGDNGLATQAQLNFPLDVAVAPGGGFYIADTQNERIRYVDAGGTITTIAGDESEIDYGGDGGPAVDAALATPAGMAVAPNGDLYFGDVSNNRVRYIDSSGIINSAVGDDAPGGYDGAHTVATETSLYNPYSVAFDPSGNLYIADSTNCLIREVNTSGIIANVVGVPGKCGFGHGNNEPGTSSWVNRPYAIAVDAAGDVFIADTHDDIVREYVASSSSSTTTAVTSSANPSLTGQSVTFTADVTSSSGTVTDGRVAFTEGGSVISSCPGSTVAAGVAICTINTGVVGTHTIGATYTAGAGFSGSTSLPFTQTVDTAHTTLSLASSADPATANQSFTVTASIAVTSPGSSSPTAPTGTVAFKNGTASISGCTTQAVSAGKASCATSLAAGTYSFTAVYSGDGNFSGSTATPLGQTVNAATGTTFNAEPGDGRTLSVGANGAVWLIGTNPAPGGYGIYRWTGSGWQSMPGGAVQIAVGPTGNASVINSAHQIYELSLSGGVTHLPGSANAIGVGADSAMWVIGTNPVPGGYGIYRWTGSKWSAFTGGAVHVAVGPSGNASVINSAHQIYELSLSGGVTHLPGTANAISVGANGAMWVIGTNPVPGGYGVYRWTGSAWQTMPGGAVQIAVDQNGNPWITNSSGAIYRFS